MLTKYISNISGGVGRIGFTLAEVLVTLAVIGVVASLTIAPLVKNYQKSQWRNGYKSTFSIINQATRMVIADNGGTLLGAWEDFGTDMSSMYNAYLPYLKIVKTCENQNPHGTCFASSYTYLNGNSAFSASSGYSIVLSNGTSLYFFADDGTDQINDENLISIDINGKKGPNVNGKDMHAIYVYINSDPVKPQTWQEPEGNITSWCPSDLASSFGQSCGVRILRGDYAEDY